MPQRWSVILRATEPMKPNSPDNTQQTQNWGSTCQCYQSPRATTPKTAPKDFYGDTSVQPTTAVTSTHTNEQLPPDHEAESASTKTTEIDKCKKKTDKSHNKPIKNVAPSRMRVDCSPVLFSEDSEESNQLQFSEYLVGL